MGSQTFKSKGADLHPGCPILLPALSSDADNLKSERELGITRKWVGQLLQPNQLPDVTTEPQRVTTNRPPT